VSPAVRAGARCGHPRLDFFCRERGLVAEDDAAVPDDVGEVDAGRLLFRPVEVFGAVFVARHAAFADGEPDWLVIALAAVSFAAFGVFASALL
jgi:hypothetical protein